MKKQRSEVRGQRSEIGDQKSEVRGQRLTSRLFLSCFLLLLAPLAPAQTNVPLQLFVTLPEPPPQNVTNLFVTVLDQRVTTNSYTTIVTNPPPKLVEILDGVIDPRLGSLLFQEVTNALTFTLGPFVANAFVTLHYRNLSGARMLWPSNIWWLTSSGPPTNQVRGAVLLEEIRGEIRGTP